MFTCDYTYRNDDIGSSVAFGKVQAGLIDVDGYYTSSTYSLGYSHAQQAHWSRSKNEDDIV